MKKFYLAVVALFCTAIAFSQGVTTSAISGQVTDENGEPLGGASVVAVHTPTGSTYGAATDFDGFYRISGMRAGGPFRITFSYLGFNEDVKENIFLTLGRTSQFNVTLSESATALQEVVVTATSTGIFGANKTGTETTISQREVSTIPAASRSIADFVRLTPQAQVSEGNDGFSISLAGQNNRYNAIYIDGAVNNDVFGLAGSGTNGGQTGVNPLSVDAIETFQINIAPFDVRQSGFSGGSINAITRSGSNNWEGSAYSFVRNESLAGKTPVDLVGDDEEREKLADFSALTYGVRVGGPIIKDKLFFFLNYERQEDETPQPFNFSNYAGRSSLSDLQGLTSFLNTTYGYDPGIFDNNTRTLESNRITAKLDWNINQDHKLSLRYGYTDADNLEARNSGFRNIGFINGSEAFISKTNSLALELNSRFGNKFANNFILGYTIVRDDRDPAGDPFPTVDIQDGGGTISFGAEPFSTANLLDQDVLTLTNNFEIYAGRHTVTLGANLEFAKLKNLFFAYNYGDYTFEDQFDSDGNLISSGLNQFLTGQDADVYQHGYSLVGSGITGDESAGASEFDTFQAGFYIQDEVQMTDDFRVTLGARIDIPYWSDGTENPDFNNRTIPILESFGKDLQGARVGQGIDPTAMFAPRLGFNWDVNGEGKTQIRGGIGVFTSRLPLVWPGGTYNNNGITGGFMFEFNQPFVADVNNQFEDPAPGTGGTGGNVDLIAKDFKLPQVVKYNIAIDQKLPFWNLIASADFLYTDVITDVYYEQLNLKGPAGFYEGADNRPFYDRRDEIDPTYQAIYLASNTGGGYAHNTTLSIRKPYENGFAGQIAWTFGDSYKVFDGTSSQNSSQWRNIQTVNGKNSQLPVTRSDFALGNRITANVSYELRWNDNIKTTFGLFYEGYQSQPYSFTYREGRDLLNDDSRDNALMYIPASSDEIVLVGDDPAAEWNRLNTFIESIEYLRENRGRYAERNASRGIWSHIVDLKVLQDFSLDWGGKKHTFQISADMFNFTNFLNEDWGKRNFIRSEVSPLQTVSTGSTPTFSINNGVVNADGSPNIEEIDDFGLASSRWQAQIGLRYIFN
ncbi:TonB-dependent receptor [Lentiprolixibacter aurantiacus]|uniref:Carboxypeptidase regulatory-like domain-containing protein n=1 Tax=Lentiprolixibacter aurantiacus TaxID=2993939 RepID=A0AAE3SMD0_9FLAO|nr:TonB-dependent receptor [Lentiprolixibacter aurantiacus]MCX2718320.1 carboxypeptidase regulatory-like domain-containing protein [Lentiprolixibacter aurantiacus]